MKLINPYDVFAPMYKKTTRKLIKQKTIDEIKDGAVLRFAWSWLNVIDKDAITDEKIVKNIKRIKKHIKYIINNKFTDQEKIKMFSLTSAVAKKIASSQECNHVIVPYQFGCQILFNAFNSRDVNTMSMDLQDFWNKNRSHIKTILDLSLKDNCDKNKEVVEKTLRLIQTL